MTPIFPIISRYPFLKITAKIFKDIDIEKEVSKFPELLDEAKKIVESSLERKKSERSYLKVDIICSDCEEKCVECKILGNFENCNLCCKCFENCKKDLPKEEWRLEAKRSVLRYILSRSIVSQLESKERVRFAVVESSFYADLMKKESDPVLKILASDFGLKLKGWNVHVTSYLKASSRIKSPEWRLVNRRINSGYVETDRKEVERIIIEMLRLKLAEEVPTVINVNIKRGGRKIELEKDVPEVKFFPPCMKEILAQLKSGLNVSHSARFVIASFMLNVGMKVEEVIDVFRSVPDFNEEKTIYQVEHIAGLRGKRVEYLSPSCDTMRTYQLCISDCKVSHPINYYRKFKNRKRTGKHA